MKEKIQRVVDFENKLIVLLYSIENAPKREIMIPGGKNTKSSSLILGMLGMKGLG